MTGTEGRPDVSLADKLDAVSALLNSVALGRSEQLRQLLRYICTEELEGRGTAIHEHGIGVNALGRPADYSPETDSTVRSRVHELRKRLEEYYRSEGHGDPIRVELPKGTYRPRFIRAESLPQRAPLPGPDLSSVVAGPLTKRRTLLLPPLSIVALAALAAWWIDRADRVDPAEAAVRGAWGPILDTREPVTIAVATTMQLWVRNLNGQPPPRKDPPFALQAPDAPEFREWYSRMKQSSADGLFLHPNAHSPLWGDAAAAIAATRFLTSRGVRTEVLPERAVRPAALKSRSAIVLGRPEYSAAAQALELPGGFTVRYTMERQEVGIVDDATGDAFYREDGGRTNYGLITVAATSEPLGESHRTIVCSGINSDGAQAAMDFLTSPAHLEVLASAMGIRSGDRWPEAFQVVVRTRSSDTFTIRAEYAAHRILRSAR